MAEKKFIDVTFEFGEGRTIAGVLEDLEDIAGLRIVSVEFHAPMPEADCEDDD